MQGVLHKASLRKEPFCNCDDGAKEMVTHTLWGRAAGKERYIALTCMNLSISCSKLPTGLVPNTLSDGGLLCIAK